MGRNQTEETKKTLSEKLSGKNNPNYGKSFSLERREKHSKIMKEYWEGRKQKNLSFPEHKHKTIKITQDIIDKIEFQYSYLNMFPIKENTAYIYMLTDPTDNNNIRYIGKSEKLKDRLTNHILNDYKYYYTKKTCWIVSLLNQNQVPTMHVLETCTMQNWGDKEKYWIKYHKDQEYDLVNETDGGDGISNPSEEIRLKKSISMSGEKNHNYGKHLPEETKSKISDSLKGHEVPQETRSKISETLKVSDHPNKQGLSEEHKKHISESHINNPKCIEATKLTWQDPKVREKRTESITESWEDGQVREKRIEGINNYWESEEGRLRKKSMAEDSDRMKRLSDKAAEVKRQKRLESKEYQEEVKLVSELYIQGLSILQIHKDINKSQNWIKLRLVSSGIKLRNKSESFNNQYTKSHLISSI